MTYPVVLGKGRKLFPEGKTAKLELDEVKAFDSGPVLILYRSG